MKIPSKFKLFGIPVTVKQKAGLIKERGYIGFANYPTQSIVLDISVAPLETTEQAFYHERLHWILFLMGKDDLRNDEEFVDTLAHLMYQADKTAEYGEIECVNSGEEEVIQPLKPE